MPDENVESRSPAVLLPKDLDEWVIVRTGCGDRFIGKPTDAGHALMTLSPAYELLQQVQIQAGRMNAPARIVVPLEFEAARKTVVVVPSAITFLREASAAERRMWLSLIEQAENVRRQIAMANAGFVSANADVLKNGTLRT